MGVYGGPEITSDGLVLALDGANYKSFKGEATTNELLDITWIGDGGGGGTLVTDNNLKYNGYPTYYYTPGTSLNSYLYGGNLDSGRTSTVWTFSCYVKREDGAPITSLDVYMYYPNSDGYGAGTIQDVGNGWYRISRTRTGASSYISLCGFTGFASGVKYYLSGAQLEKKSYTTTYVSTNTTRGTTVATGGGWADLTGRGNNGELVNGVRESSGNLGALVFDGADDYVTVGSLGSQFTNFTVEIWFKSDSVTNYRNPIDCNWLVENGSYSNLGPRLEQNSAGNLNWIVGSGSDVYSFVTLVPSGLSSIPYHHAVITKTSSTNFNGYYNGNYTSSLSFSGWAGSMLNVNIGRGFSPSGERWFIGKIPSVKIYNRALTAAEIRQNFNANRSRYGI